MNVRLNLPFLKQSSFTSLSQKSVKDVNTIPKYATYFVESGGDL
jgi:hypothetical protein